MKTQLIEEYKKEVENTKRVVDLMEIYPQKEAIYKAIDEIGIKVRDAHLMNATNMQEFIVCSKMGWAHKSFYTPKDLINKTAEPDAWAFIDGKIVPAEIKITIHDLFFATTLKVRSKGRLKGTLKCLDINGKVHFWAVYNSAPNLKKIRENAEKLTIAVVFDGDTGTGLTPLFGAYIDTGEILTQLNAILKKALLEGKGINKNGDYVRNGNTVDTYVSPKDMIYFDKAYKNKFAKKN